MKNTENIKTKYGPDYICPKNIDYSWVTNNMPGKAPEWCSVDLRDGNQALIVPMNLEERLEYFNMLVGIGFKIIDVGNPAVSEVDYEFIRMLITKKLIPEDVTIQVMAGWKKDKVFKAFQSVNGAKNVIIHIFHPMSDMFLQTALEMTREQCRENVDELSKTVKKLAAEYVKSGKVENLGLEFTPEGFNHADPEYALEICNLVLEEWLPEFGGKIILNFPATVENAMPQVFAGQIEYINKNIKYRNQITLSIHTHNDRGCAIAAAEMAVLAGADRVEGTLFGNGERTGNADLITMALNLMTDGVDPKLDFSHLPEIKEVYERLTGMSVNFRQPYAGDLVFTSLTGAHQDAIANGIAKRENASEKRWQVPYLPIDPADIGRTYESDIIKINANSGKGGVSYILKTHSGFILPERMKKDVSDSVKNALGNTNMELSGSRVYEIFENKYINGNSIFQLPEVHFRQVDGISAEVTIRKDNKNYTIISGGNGRLDATSNGIKKFFGINYELTVYEEHALSNGSEASAAAYVGISFKDEMFWGVGIDSDIIKASIGALCVAVNSLLKQEKLFGSMNDMMVLIMNYIQNHYEDVTLDDLIEEFHFTKPYMSKYIKMNTGQTFGEIVREIRMKKACDMLKNTKLTVETISQKVGYPTVEHFNRLFKKTKNESPLQYRNRHIQKVK